jgi:hypothetical protein
VEWITKVKAEVKFEIEIEIRYLSDKPENKKPGCESVRVFVILNFLTPPFYTTF